MSEKGTKHDGEKVMLDLISEVALTEIGKVYTYGAKKYGKNNWRKGIEWSRVLGATLRHLLAFKSGENIDAESGLGHLSHAATSLTFLLEYEKTHKKLDDRYFLPKIAANDVFFDSIKKTYEHCLHKNQARVYYGEYNKKIVLVCLSCGSCDHVV